LVGVSTAQVNTAEAATSPPGSAAALVRIGSIRARGRPRFSVMFLPTQASVRTK